MTIEEGSSAESWERPPRRRGESGSCHLGQRRGRGSDASEHPTEAGGGWRSEGEQSLAILEPSAPGAKAKLPSKGDVPSPGARAHQLRRAALRERWQQQARHPRWGERPRAHPLGDPASSPHPLEVCKLSPGGSAASPGSWGRGGRFLARRLRCRRRCHRLTALLEGSAPCQVSGGKHTPPIHNCSPRQGNTRALPHTHTRRWTQRSLHVPHPSSRTARRPPRRAPGRTRRGVSRAASGHSRIPQFTSIYKGRTSLWSAKVFTNTDHPPKKKKMHRIFPTPCPVTCPLDQVTSRPLPRTNPCKQVRSRDGSLGKCNKSG